VRRVIVICVAALVLASAALGATTKSSTPAQKPDLGKITVVAEWLLWSAHAPVLAAIQEGYYEDLGLEVNFVAPPNPGDQVKFVVGNRAQIGLTQEPDVILSVGKGIPIKMVGQLWDENPTGLLLRPDSGIKTPKDLVGKTLGVTNTPDATGPVQTIIAKAGVDPSKVKVVNPGYGGIPLLLKKKIDGLHSVVGGEPSVIGLETGESWPFMRYTRFGVPNFPLLVWFTTNNYAKEHPDVIRAFIKGTARGMRDVRTNKADFAAAMDTIKKANSVFTAEQHDASAADVKPYWATSPALNPSILKQTRDWMTTVKVGGSTWLPKNQVKPVAAYYTNAYTK
jgi:putative hydroxymethylpyrimidine transport system substrate-binding protein